MSHALVSRIGSGLLVCGLLLHSGCLQDEVRALRRNEQEILRQLAEVKANQQQLVARVENEARAMWTQQLCKSGKIAEFISEVQAGIPGVCSAGSLETALLLARSNLAQDPESLDWASLQLYAHPSEGEDTRPLQLRPYRGLLAFWPQHHRFFFGREKEVRELCERFQTLLTTQAPRMLIVDGASGAGKSSFVQAGASQPLLSLLGPQALALRLLPGNAPLQALERALALPRGGRPLLLLVEQLEELIVQTESEAERIEFLQRLWALAKKPPAAGESTVSVLMTLRSDFVRQLGALPLDAQGHTLAALFAAQKHRLMLAPLQPEQLLAARYVVGLQQRGDIPEDMTAVLVTQFFNQGRAAVVLNGPWFISEIASDVPYGVAPLPLVSETGRPGAALTSIEAGYVSATTKAPQAAADFLRYLVGPQSALTRARVGRQSVSDRATWQHPDVQADPVLQAFAAQLPHMVPSPTHPAMRSFWEPGEQALRQVLRGVAPEQALHAAQVLLDRYLQPPPLTVSETPIVLLSSALLLLGALYATFRVRRERLVSLALKSRDAYAYIAPALIGMTAQEWAAQGEEIDPASMPMTGIANAHVSRAPVLMVAV